MLDPSRLIDPRQITQFAPATWNGMPVLPIAWIDIDITDVETTLAVIEELGQMWVLEPEFDACGYPVVVL